MSLKTKDRDVFDAIAREKERQQNNLEMIASENYTSPAVIEAMGSHLTDKYAEGYPGKRYYGGCENVDVVETLAIERAKKIFGCEHVNVQPHSGTQANLEAYLALIEVGDTLMGMDLSCGGHLSHGHPLNFSGKHFKIVPYGVNRETGRIDFDEVREIALREKPRLIVCGASAYPRAIDFKKFREIADEAGAYLVADIAHIAGLVAKGCHPDPVPYCDVVTTTTHKTLRGPRGGMIMCREKYAKDIDRSVFPGNQGGPLMHVIAAKAVCFKEVLSDEFGEYIKRVVSNSAVLAETLMENGIKLVTDGTDNHIILIDLRPIDVTGKDAEALLQRSGIIANKNTIPYDPQKPFIASGIRLGTPVLTTRGMGADEVRQIGQFISRVLKDRDEKTIAEVKKGIMSLCGRFPVE
ncbi:MAG: serine hydroxymethyltransferase [Elusimicrobia bacterium]|nr:serine hydroxymethyltransferase [Elusimicrobiota bacterium]